MGKTTILMMIGAAALLSACNRESDNAASSGAASERATISHGQAADTNAGAYAPDNTGVNKRDRSGDTLTAQDQGGTDADREITRAVRRAVNGNDQLSTDAKNVKIVTQNGKVTLRGPVSNAQEQQTVADLAKAVQGVTSVDNQLEVKSNQ